MKVIVRPAFNRVTKTDMEREIEKLFQENKDLRVDAGHAQDEIHSLLRQNDILRQQSEARRQALVEKEALIEELNDQIATLKASGIESMDGLNSMVKFWQDAIAERDEARRTAEEYRISLMESDARVDELEKRNEWLENENEQYEETIRNLRTEAMASKDVAYEQMKRADNLASRLAFVEEQRDEAFDEANKHDDTNSTLIQENEELREELERMKHANNCLCDQVDRQADELASLRHEKYEQTEHLKALNSQTWELQNKLIAANNEIDNLIDERDNANDRADQFESLYRDADKDCGHYRTCAETWQEKHNKMERIATDYGNEIDRLRKVVTDLQTHRFTMEEFANMCMSFLNNRPSADKET